MTCTVHFAVKSITVSCKPCHISGESLASTLHEMWKNGKVYVHSPGRMSTFTEEKRPFLTHTAGLLCSKTKNIRWRSPRSMPRSTQRSCRYAQVKMHRHSQSTSSGYLSQHFSTEEIHRLQKPFTQYIYYKYHSRSHNTPHHDHPHPDAYMHPLIPQGTFANGPHIPRLVRSLCLWYSISSTQNQLVNPAGFNIPHEYQFVGYHPDTWGYTPIAYVDNHQ